MSLEQPLINPSEEPSIIPSEQKMEDKKSCCEILCDCFFGILQENFQIYQL